MCTAASLTDTLVSPLLMAAKPTRFTSGLSLNCSTWESTSDRIDETLAQLLPHLKNSSYCSCNHSDSDLQFARLSPNLEPHHRAYVVQNGVKWDPNYQVDCRAHCGAKGS